MTAPISPTSPTDAFSRPLRTSGAAHRFFRHPLARIGLALLFLILLAAVFAGPLSKPFFVEGSTQAYHDPGHIYRDGLDVLGVPHAPTPRHYLDTLRGKGFFLGADTLGRDVWTRVLYGARLSLSIAACAMVTSTIIGTLVGLFGGFFGGRTDRFLTRITEIVASLPTILLAITLTLVLPQTWRDVWPFSVLGLDPRLVIAIGLVTWTSIARAVRGQVLAIKEREFVEAARALGQSNARILFRHIFPNVLPTVITLATLATATNILLEAGLSYLGLGAPKTPSWGSMIAEGQPYFISAPWITLVPGVAIVLAVGAFNLLGNALTESLETRR